MSSQVGKARTEREGLSVRGALRAGVGEPGRPEWEPGRGHGAQGPGRAGARAAGARGTEGSCEGPRKRSKSQTKRFGVQGP